MSTHLDDRVAASWTWFLAGILFVALLIRLWGTWYGLPFSYYNDEYHEVMRALQLGTGSFNFDRTTKGGFYFLLFLEYGVYFVWLKLTGAVQSAHDFAILFVRDPSMFYLLGRVTAAVIGSLTVAAVFFLTRRAYSITAGLLAAVFILFNVLHIDLSRRIGVDVPMTLMVTLSLYFGVCIATAGRRKHYLLAALCAAVAVTTKLPGVLVLVPLLLAHTYYSVTAGRSLREWLRSRDLWLAVALFVLVLAATNPGIFLQAGYLRLFAPTPAPVADVEIAGGLAALEASSRPNLYLYYLSAMLESMGWPLFLLGILSAIYALWKRTPADVMLLTFALANYIVISSTTSDKLYYPRYALPIIVTLAVLSGRLLADATQLLPKARLRAVILAGALLIVMPVAQTMTNAHVLAQPDTRTLAKEWFEDNVPAGRRVLIEGGWIYPLRETVQLSDSKEALRRRISYWKATDPRRAKLLEYQIAAHEGAGYELMLVSLESVASLNEYAKQDVEYFVVMPQRFLQWRRASRGAAQLIEDLRSDDRVKLLKRFEGDFRTPLSPTIEIYQLIPDPGDPNMRTGSEQASGDAIPAEQ